MVNAGKFATFIVSVLVVSASAASAASLQHPVAAGDRFKDCPHCPEMVVIPGGRFEEAERFVAPRKQTEPHMTSVPYEYALGVYDVTRSEFAYFAKQTHRALGTGCQFNDGNRWRIENRLSWENPGFPQTPRDPVVCVSYHDAQDYVDWLNSVASPESKQRLGLYHLPSSREWEFAAQEGHTTFSAFPGGAVLTHDEANDGVVQCWPCGGEIKGKDRWLYTSPVGSFPPNAFGLYDMMGDVWQMVGDCLDQEIPIEKALQEVASRSCRTVGIRGASFDDTPETLQFMVRNPFRTHIRNNANGFRVARSLTQ